MGRCNCRSANAPHSPFFAGDRGRLSQFAHERFDPCAGRRPAIANAGRKAITLEQPLVAYIDTGNDPAHYGCVRYYAEADTTSSGVVEAVLGDARRRLGPRDRVVLRPRRQTTTPRQRQHDAGVDVAGARRGGRQLPRRVTEGRSAWEHRRGCTGRPRRAGRRRRGGRSVRDVALDRVRRLVDAVQRPVPRRSRRARGRRRRAEASSPGR